MYMCVCMGLWFQYEKAQVQWQFSKLDHVALLEILPYVVIAGCSKVHFPSGLYKIHVISETPEWYLQLRGSLLLHILQNV